jgi:ATP-dependent DNA ligase
MLPTLVGEPFDDKMWVFEIKWDGFRLVTEKRSGKLNFTRADFIQRKSSSVRPSGWPR